MILSGMQIGFHVEWKDIKIEPFRKGQLNSNSYDIRLGEEIAVYSDVVWADFTCREPGDLPGSHIQPKAFKHLDSRLPATTVKHRMDSKLGMLLKPGIGYLGHTLETIWSDSFVPILDGKSSIGRLFVQIHQTAGFGDIGYPGQYTLEIVVTHPIILYPGMRIGQVRFQQMDGPRETYNGHYLKESMGPVGSKAWKQMEEDGIPPK